MKRLLIAYIFVSLLASCNSGEREEGTKIVVKPNGDSLVLKVDKNGILNGPFEVYNHDSTFATGFFKNDKRDSLYILYWPNGNPKLITYYIEDQEEGLAYAYDLDDSTNITTAFYRHDTVKVVSKTVYHSEDSLQSVVEYYELKDSLRICIGSLVYQGNKLDIPNSSYYIVSYNKSYESKLLPLGKESIISIDVFEKNTSIFADIEYIIIEGPEPGIRYPFSKKTIIYGKSAHFDIAILPEQKGWYFVKGLIRVSDIEKSVQREIPMYFNYYVY